MNDGRALHNARLEFGVWGGVRLIASRWTCTDQRNLDLRYLFRHMLSINNQTVIIMKFMNVRAAWSGFRECCETNDEVRLDNRDKIVFYAGATAMFRIIHNIAESHEGEAREILIAALITEMAGE